MKKLLMGIFALALLAAGALLAQDQNITGTWQGTLQVGNGLRTVVKITKPEDGGLKAVFYSIDQGGQGIGVSSITVEGSTVKIVIAGIGGTYEGKLSSDGNSINGTWTQGPNPLPLNFTRATPDTAWAIPEPAPPPKPMAADADPAFEVASIKLSANPDAPGFGINVRNRQFRTVNTTVSNLIEFSYGVHAKQIVGGPDWLTQQKYDILAEPDGEGQPNDKQWKIMIQKLLADRCKLTFHHDKQDLSVYTIVIAKDGPKLTASTGDPNGLPGLGFRGLGDMIARNATMADFAGVMQATAMDKPVVDETGLKGRFDFTLKWTPDEFQFSNFGGPKPAPPADSASAPPDLYKAIQEQLGLRLESTKAPTDVLVIDHVEKPSPN